jgi:hypothetical protein
MLEALHEYENAHPDQLELIPSEDQFYGFSRGTNRLAKHIQWVFVPAVKEASLEDTEARNTALGQLLARTVRSKVSFDDDLQELRQDARKRYAELLKGQQHVLQEVSASLTNRLTQWAHPDAKLTLEWAEDPEKSVRIEEPFAQARTGDGDFLGRVARMGHGLQRSFLLALLQELSGGGADQGPTLLLACEEPELYQHPPQARHLSHVLKTLSESNSQVIVTTHSPLFVSGDGFEDVRLVRRDSRSGASTCQHVTFDQIIEKTADIRGEPIPIPTTGQIAKLHQELQPAINEIFFAQCVILAEGMEDVGYITTYLNLLGYDDEFRRLGGHIVPVSGKSHLLLPCVILRELGVPVFVVFDSDADRPDSNGSRSMHELNNRALLVASGYGTSNPMPNVNLWTPDLVMWKSEMGKVVKEDFPADALLPLQEEIRLQYGHEGGLDKNALFIASWLASAWTRGHRAKSLELLCETIMTFARARALTGRRSTAPEPARLS